MNRHSAIFAGAALALAGFTLCAEDFQPLMKVAQATWPEKKHIGVICDYRMSKDQILVLARAAGEGSSITVADTRVAEQANAAAGILAGRRTDFVVVLPQDHMFGGGSFATTMALRRLASRGIPAIGTTPGTLKQGASFAMGDGTQGQLLVTERPIGTVSVVLPHRDLAYQKTSLVSQKAGMATIAVHSAR